MTTFENIPTEELLGMLAGARQNETNYKQVMQNIIANAKATDYYQEADNLAKAEATLIENLTTEIKARAVAEYNASGNKKPFAGVTVKVFKVFEVKNLNDMKVWVLENFKAAVSTAYDMKQIENLAKTTEIPGTVVKEEARAEIASKLP